MNSDQAAGRHKVCISMVTYSETADQNFEHDIDFVRQLSRVQDVTLIVERGGVRPDVPAKRIFVQKSHGRILRVAEHFAAVLRLRLSGTRTFYSRNSLMNAIIAGLISRLSGGRTYLWSCGELDKGRAATLRERGWLAYAFERMAYFCAFRLVTGVVTGTATMKAYYARNLNIPASKITVLPNWVDLSRFSATPDAISRARASLNISEEDFVLIFPRSLSERHGTRYLPDVVERLVQSGLNVVLLATGRGALDGWLRDSFAQRNMAERLRILGGVPNREMPVYFAVSDVMVLPSLTEGFPRVIIESMAMGTPFVAHDVGGIPDVISDKQKANLVPLGDVEAFSTALARFSQAPEWQASMIAEGNDWVKQYDVAPVVAAFANLFANGRSAPR